MFVPEGRSGGLLVRTDGPAAALIPVIRSIAAAEAPDLPVSSAETLAARDARDRTLMLQAGGATAGAGLLALFLSALGLYALVAFSVAQRTREIGVRLALGADRSRIVSEFFLRGMRLCLLGIAL
ncbi:MAG: FtsX-like permease family protein, partial [Longimicrobiales bacterium]